MRASPLFTKVPVLVPLMVLIVAFSSSAAAIEAEEPQTISFTPYLGVLPSLAVSVKGVNARFLFDTAGGITAISPAFARMIGCKPWGRVTGYRMRGQRLDIAKCDQLGVDVGDAELSVPTAGVFDFESILPPDAPELHGSLAMDAFSKSAITLDLAGERLWIETESSLKKRIESAEELPVRFDRSIQGLALTPLVGVRSDNGLLWFELDTGSDAPLIVAKHAIEDLKATRSDNGKYRVRTTMGKALSLEAEASVADLIIDGNIGAPVLKGWLVTIDFRSQRLWVSTRPE